MHGYFAGHGYAVCRVDMRGSGESDGLMQDGYLQQEQDDAVEVIERISRQPWCNGNAGMMGKSWGGFNSLQVAARRPAALKAIITVGFTDNRFAGDIHWQGGCLLNDNFWWGSIMLACQSRPVDPEIVGDRWKEIWLRRLEHMPISIPDWAKHQRYDDYWKHGSVCEDYDAIQVPVTAVSGWADSYANAAFKLLSNLKFPRKGFVGALDTRLPAGRRPTSGNWVFAGGRALVGPLAKGDGEQREEWLHDSGLDGALHGAGCPSPGQSGPLGRCRGVALEGRCQRDDAAWRRAHPGHGPGRAAGTRACSAQNSVEPLPSCRRVDGRRGVRRNARGSAHGRRHVDGLPGRGAAAGGGDLGPPQL
ncbi:dipeptidyl-peptidase [Trypanosoma conorhini]|uniref:Dipeptidyl-peptidase n=1 Tax=Trypanosoma conorhini TaxID=83891 RepID=A0A3R7NDQ5_9TRYP|nr:dipeptidyl-peptidase [Trypanosoma conorhini]RNF20645.1 dipeptidyl-peptidase [Trypanosoma conorhini]